MKGLTILQFDIGNAYIHSSILCYSKVDSEAARNSLLSEQSSHISTFPQTSSVLTPNLISICQEHKHSESIQVQPIKFSVPISLSKLLGQIKQFELSLGSLWGYIWNCYSMGVGKVKKRTWNVRDVSHICWNMQTTQASFAAEFLGHTFIQTDNILCHNLIWIFPPPVPNWTHFWVKIWPDGHRNF